MKWIEGVKFGSLPIIGVLIGQSVRQALQGEIATAIYCNAAAMTLIVIRQVLQDATRR
jgi:hypothetical protein